MGEVMVIEWKQIQYRKIGYFIGLCKQRCNRPSRSLRFHCNQMMNWRWMKKYLRSRHELVATWFTLVAPKTENLFSIYDEKKMLGLSVKSLTGFMILKLLLQSHRWKCFHVYSIRTFKNGSNAIVFETRGKTGMRKSFWYTTEVSYEANKAWKVQSGALRWHLNENRDFFLLGSFNYLLSLNRQFEQPSKVFLN